MDGFSENIDPSRPTPDGLPEPGSSPPVGPAAWLRDRLRRTRVMTGVFYALMVEYRIEILLWAVATALPLIMLGLWSEAAASGKFVLGPLDTMRYFIAVFVVRQFTVAWVLYDFEYHVVSGKLTPFLLAPCDPTWRFFLIHIGEQGCRLPFVAALVGFAMLIYPEALRGTEARPGVWAPGWGRFALAVLAVFLAFAMRFFMQYALAMLAFWVERVSALEPVSFVPYVFLSGMVFPVTQLQAQYGDWAYELVLLTPFPWMAWFPASLLVPGVEVPIVRGFATQLVWIGVFLVLQRFLWHRGLRKYSAMGA
ncbi:MAG: ABC-2 family transporter protein [Planctomycetota bacterium]